MEGQVPTGTPPKRRLAESRASVQPEPEPEPEPEPGDSIPVLRWEKLVARLLASTVVGAMPCVREAPNWAAGRGAGAHADADPAAGLPRPHDHSLHLPSSEDPLLAFWTKSAQSLQSLLLEVAQENVHLRARQSAAVGAGLVELHQNPDGSAQLMVDGQLWQKQQTQPQHRPSAEANSPLAAPAEHQPSLSAEERDAMDAAVARITAMNSEVDRARADGKLIMSRPAAEGDSRSTTGSATVHGEVDIGMSAKHKQLGPDSFRKLGMLGKGAVGKCYLVREKGTNQLYAMKVMGKADIVQRKKGKRIMLEREVMTISRHPLVVALHASFQSTDFLYHVMEYCPGGPLYGVLRRQPYCRFDEATTRFYVGETILALEYLHMQGYMYRDLKPENILLSAQGHIRLSDFDLVRAIVTTAKIGVGVGGNEHVEQTYLHARVQARSFVGTAEYVAPEVVQRQPYELAAEWWSIGILTFEMVSGYTPFVGCSTAATFRRILHADLVFRDDIALGRDCKSFIQGCLQRDPLLRLGHLRGAAELKSHRWMRHVKWSLLANTERPPFIPNMPLLPEAADGADASKSAVVTDRYRLFGRHFNARDRQDEVGQWHSGNGTCPLGDPFADFDWTPT